MAIEVEGLAESGRYSGAGNDWQQLVGGVSRSWTGAEDNEPSHKRPDVTFGANQLLRLSHLEELPRAVESAQWPDSTLYSSLGSGKSSAFLRTLVTSGAPAKTVTDRIESPVVRTPPRPREHVVLHQQWEGYVERRTSSGFQALLVDMTTGTDDEERTEIDVNEVSEFDRPLIEPGAVFYWSLGYRVRTSGQREGVSMIRFRRLPIWTPEELREAAEAAASTSEVFGWAGDSESEGRNEDRSS